MTIAEAEQFRTALNELLIRESFQRSPAISRLFTYLVQQVLAGEAGSLKESVIGHDLYGRPAGYDPKLDSVVRVSANRLRIRLEEHYRINGYGGVRIVLRKGSYVPVLEVQEKVVAPDVSEPHAGGADDIVPETLLVPSFTQRDTIEREAPATWFPWFSRRNAEVAVVALSLGIAAFFTISWMHKRVTTGPDRSRHFRALSLKGTRLAMPSNPVRERKFENAADGAPGAQTAEQDGASVPTNPQAYTFYIEGVQRLRGFDPVMASQLLEREIALEPNFALAHSELSHALILLGQEDRGLEEAHKGQALAVHLSTIDQLRVRAISLAAEHRYEEAAATYGELFALVPRDLEYVRSQASLLENAGHDQEAVKLLEPLAGSGSQHASIPVIYLTIGQAYSNLGNSRTAFYWAQKAEDTAKENGDLVLYERAHTAEAYTLDRMGSPRKALRKTSEAAELATKFGDKTGGLQALVATAEIENRMGMLKEARAILLQVARQAKALGQTQRQMYALTALGQNYNRVGNARQALASYQQSLAVAVKFHQSTLIHAAEVRVAEAQSELGRTATHEQISTAH